MLGALRLDGKVILCLLLALSSSALALTLAETSSAVCRIGPEAEGVNPPERSCDVRFWRGATVGRDKEAISLTCQLGQSAIGLGKLTRLRLFRLCPGVFAKSTALRSPGILFPSHSTPVLRAEALLILGPAAISPIFAGAGLALKPDLSRIVASGLTDIRPCPLASVLSMGSDRTSSVEMSWACSKGCARSDDSSGGRSSMEVTEHAWTGEGKAEVVAVFGVSESAGGWA